MDNGSKTMPWPGARVSPQPCGRPVRCAGTGCAFRWRCHAIRAPRRDPEADARPRGRPRLLAPPGTRGPFRQPLPARTRGTSRTAHHRGASRLRPPGTAVVITSPTYLRASRQTPASKLNATPTDAGGQDQHEGTPARPAHFSARPGSGEPGNADDRSSPAGLSPGSAHWRHISGGLHKLGHRPSSRPPTGTPRKPGGPAHRG